jgi:hypothetical protein
MKTSLLAAFLALSACGNRLGPATSSAPPSRFLKGQTHLHSNNSGDSETSPEEVAGWYAARGYDFIVFTDHNYVTGRTAAPQAGELLLIPGAELTQNRRSCEPAPEPGMACLLHVNSLFVSPEREGPVSLPPGGKARREIFLASLEESQRLGGIAQLNHPNFHYSAGAALITELAGRGVALLEIANESSDSNNEGDASHPSTEALWDSALSAGARIYGVATDDAHHYHDAEAVRAKGQSAYPGDLGFIMVRAEKDAQKIREAILRGDFYSSTGVLLRRAEGGPEALEVEVLPEPGRSYHISFIGQEGKLLGELEGPSARFPLSRLKKGGYVRARVEDDRGRRAWVQPVWRE